MQGIGARVRGAARAGRGPQRGSATLGALAGVVGVLFMLMGTTAALAQDAAFPLEPPDTNSPRGTLFNLIDNVAEAKRVLDEAERDYESTPGLFKSDAVRAQEARARELLARSAASLDLGQVRPALRAAVQLETVLLLKEVLDRISLPSAETIPDAQDVAATGITSWRIPRTSIDIAQVSEGPRAGEFLFSAETVRQAGDFYRRIQDLPYLTTGTEGIYQRHISTPGRLVAPKSLVWVRGLPDWFQQTHYGHAVWQWAGLVAILLILVLLLRALSILKRRLRVEGSPVRRIARRLIVPVAAVLCLWPISYFLAEQLSFSGRGLAVVLKGLLIPEALFEAYIAFLVPVLVAEIIITSPRIDSTSLDANMMRMFARILGLAAGLALVFAGANELGVPLVPLVASLGVGGLAVALAARPTLENLIGGIILYIDQPVRVGDFCSFGDHTGTVERIGVRSTQIRARDRTVITVPNATFADFEIVNWARCDQMQILATIGLRYETKLDQLRFVLAKLREMLLAHPRIDNENRRVRFVGYGSSSLDIEIRVYALTRDWGEFYAIQEDVFLRVGEIVEESGTSFAFPSRTLYMGRDKGLDDERGETAVEQVEAWRRTGLLPFPHMDQDRRAQIADSLDFPPRGSPHAQRAEAGDADEAEPLSRETEDETGPGEPERR